MTLLSGKRILLGVTGSIAAYKAADLASKLTQAGAQVDVIMTGAAQRFVTPLTFQAVTGRAVYTDLWSPPAGALPTHIAHVGLAESAALFVIAPATADTLARLATGRADDLLAVTALATRCPLVVAPAMDGGMYEHPATQANLQMLVERGVQVIEPEEGRFASGLTGRGRLPDPAVLLGAIRFALSRTGPLAGRKVVVTAGGTREPIDPVRFVSNRSSGKQGYAVTQAALDAGAEVTLISAARGLP
ncbi:MAG: bifunctional phosphopantothenoylcysteine decarboxylase/phosphopantothenate--cysteine ligase CoaBC, partial [Caldilineaceae bacterium]